MSEPDHTLAPQGGAVDDDEREIEASSAPLLDHLTELRRRLIISIAAIVVAFLACFFLSKQIFNILIIPFVEAVGKGSNGQNPTLYFAPLEFFFTRVRLSVFAAVVVSFPVLAYQAYKFIAPGLYRRERRAALPFLVAIPILFSAGASLVYFVMMPLVMRFAVGFEAEAGGGAPATYQLLTRVGDYLSLVTTLILGFGFAFQLPVFLTLLARVGILKAETLTKHRKIAIVVIFIVAAILTPPDPFSQIVLGTCILGLYELSVISVRIAEKQANAAREARESELAA
ncbi:MAG TPA: twin-arginine translocase subunit TatC [Parvularculaceae bacterium]|nr:twin-arginine translocase subunit TatC [Parvularculaceae bacterium]